MQPSAIANRACGSDSAGTRIVPATITSSEKPRLPQRRLVSSKPSTRWESATGSIPVVVVSATRTGYAPGGEGPPLPAASLRS